MEGDPVGKLKKWNNVPPPRTGSASLSFDLTGRMSPPSRMSRAVATSVAIMHNASAGQRVLIACQFRFGTRTVLF